MAIIETRDIIAFECKHGAIFCHECVLPLIGEADFRPILFEEIEKETTLVCDVEECGKIICTN